MISVLCYVDKKKFIKKLGKEGIFDGYSYEIRYKGKYKKLLRDKRKRRRKYYIFELESFFDSELDSIEFDIDFEFDIFLLDISFFSDDRRKKRKRFFKRDKYKRGKRKGKRRDKKRRRYDKRLRRKLKRY